MAQKLKLLRDIKEGDKMAPQMKVIIEQLKAVGLNKEVERETFVDKLEKSGKLSTRQPVGRILGYYLKPMKDAGFIEVIEPPAAPKAEKAAKPPKEAPKGAPSKPAKAA